MSCSVADGTADPADRIVVTRKDGELIAKRPVTFHPKSDGTEARFEIYQESEGSQRDY